MKTACSIGRKKGKVCVIRQFSPHELETIQKSSARLTSLHEMCGLHVMITILLWGIAMGLVLLDAKCAANIDVPKLWLAELLKAFAVVSAFWCVILALQIWITCIRLYGVSAGFLYLLLCFPLIIGLFWAPFLVRTELRRITEEPPSEDAMDEESTQIVREPGPGQ